jgi:hypothetical protein
MATERLTDDPSFKTYLPLCTGNVDAQEMSRDRENEREREMKREIRLSLLVSWDMGQAMDASSRQGLLASMA